DQGARRGHRPRARDRLRHRARARRADRAARGRRRLLLGAASARERRRRAAGAALSAAHPVSSDAMSEPAGDEVVALRTAPRRGGAEEWGLVRAAEGLRPAVVGGPGGFSVCVPATGRGRAERALDAWERENRPAPRPAEPDPVLDAAAIGHALVVVGLLVVFFAA